MGVLSHIKFLFGVVYILFIVVNITLVVHDKRDPVKALSWIVVMVTLPAIGLILYLFFGRNHRKQKIFNRKGLSDLETIERITKRQIYDINNPLYTYRAEISQNIEIITLLLNSSRSPLSLHNRITILDSGRKTFDSIIEAMRGAKSYIHLEYYIFEDDTIGGEIATILMDKAAEGIEVRMIYDDVGSWSLSSKFIRRLREAGVDVRCFMPVFFPLFTSNVNYRNHRKVVVVDGKVAFTGGVNIADRYASGGSFGLWRDIHLKLEGEAATMLQILFSTDWYFVSGQQLRDRERYLPKREITDEHFVQIAISGPDSDWASIMQSFFAAINKAQHHIYITTPYFLPNESILTALKVAALSGIEVRLMMPELSDSKIVHWASRSYISELLEVGVRVYLFQNGFNHSKLVTIDGIFSSVGSANMDIRSFEDNFEVAAFIYDAPLTRSLERIFLDDIDLCKELSSRGWRARPTIHKTFEAIARLFSPLL